MARCEPRLARTRSYLALKWDPFFGVEAQAHSTIVETKWRFPFRVFVLNFLPALSLLPGQMPDHDASLPSSSNGDMSGPISDKIDAEAVSPIPGMVCSNSNCCWYGAMCRAIASSK